MGQADSPERPVTSGDSAEPQLRFRYSPERRERLPQAVSASVKYEG